MNGASASGTRDRTSVREQIAYSTSIPDSAATSIISSSLSSSSLSAFPSSSSDESSSSNSNSNNDNGDGDDIFQGIKNFFNNVGTKKRYNSNNNYDNEDKNDDDNIDDDELPAGTTLLLKINATQLKPGGLRLFLMFYLMGMQNTPDRNTWRADQKLLSTPTHNDNPRSNTIAKANENNIDTDTDDEMTEKKTYVLEMLYDIDRTGMLQIEIIPSSSLSSSSSSSSSTTTTNDKDEDDESGQIRLYRFGSRPSTSYLMQESIIVDGVLDELQQLSGSVQDEEKLKTATATTTIATTQEQEQDEPPIANENRLLIPEPLNAIEIARNSLAFR